MLNSTSKILFLRNVQLKTELRYLLCVEKSCHFPHFTRLIVIFAVKFHVVCVLKFAVYFCAADESVTKMLC